MNWLLKNWYKWLSILLLLYVIAFGMLVPLRPGIMKTDTFRLDLGTEAEIHIQFYNTHLRKSDDHRIWIRVDNDHAIKAKSFAVLNDVELKAVFELPSELPIDERVAMASLLADNSVDGPMVLPAAFSLVGENAGPGEISLWLENPVSDLNMRWTYAYPWRNILEETIRNTYYHVPMWFGMMLLFLISAIYSIRLIRSDNQDYDSRVFSLNLVGTLYGLLGILTGAIWARYTWGAYWSGDIKQDMAAITLLIFLAYFLLRSAMDPGPKRSRVTAIYTLFAFAASIPLLYIIPRMQPSLHPGSGGNPGFGGDDLDNTMKTVFYPAVIGWTLFGYWLSNIVFRLNRLGRKTEEKIFT
ncbi:MAG: cytochrome c assembly protein [Saprospirales bacterium]|nr:MAG: cytochrome c assembly protein [Saprospirales bacterium]